MRVSNLFAHLKKYFVRLKKYFAHGNLQSYCCCTQPGPQTHLQLFFSPILHDQCFDNFEFKLFCCLFLHGNLYISVCLWLHFVIQLHGYRDKERSIHDILGHMYTPRPGPLQRQREVLVWLRMTQNINPIFPAQVSKVQSGLEGSPQAVLKPGLTS